MANSLLITKLSDSSFSFVVNGDVLNVITNLRNDMLSFGDECHFKTSEGANLVKLQQILFNEVTIVDGSALPVATSAIDLRVKLRSVGFWDWMDSGGSGVNAYQDLTDTTPFFGNTGRVPMVNASETKLIYTDIPDSSYLNYFPSPLQAGKMFIVNGTANGIIFIDPPSGSNALNQEDIFSTTATFTLPSTAKLTAVAWNGVILRKSDWTQTSNSYTINFSPTVGDIFQPIGII